MAEVKITRLTKDDVIEPSPVSVDDLLAAAAAGYDPTALAARRASEALNKLTKAITADISTKLGIKVPEYNYDYKIQKEIYNMAGFNFGGMSKFERQMREKQAMTEEEKALEEAKKAAKKEEWIWAEGYKGTNKDMKCRDYQFQMHEQFDIQEGTEVVDCENGFHFCRDLKDVFDYYKIGDGHRFFRVRGLVRKSDYENYGEKCKTSYITASYLNPLTLCPQIRDKLAAKSIQFLYELTPDEIFATFDEKADVHTWDTEQKALAMQHGLNYVRNICRIKELVALGYSEAFADYIVNNTGFFDKAKAAGSQTDLSMDMKVLYILKG
jgi:hypothetical protein